jgi:hypothetical protein
MTGGKGKGKMRMPPGMKLPPGIGV